MEHDPDKGSVAVAVKLLPNDVIDVEILVKKPFWAEEKNTSFLIIPEIKTRVVVYWKEKKLRLHSPMRNTILSAVVDSVMLAMSGTDPSLVRLDENGNELPPLELPRRKRRKSSFW